MMVIISYDVSTSDPGGKKRLRKVAKECQNMRRECRILYLKRIWIILRS